ncbi:MAG: tRNA uridine-5-carboxymethylaminomethyl(34) synthesis enzyme MnmG [Alphaproteobacteria bacterium]|nr:tRNA uridine-5-carboxymethylaminomethyl(34) synthesis enzyme MnmG [Alphaproteobacteria bacterium]
MFNTKKDKKIGKSKVSRETNYKVIVIGGGHAGCEAAAAAARIGSPTLLITNNKSKIGEMSCNPSIGGLGKGHLVKEIDSLDGIIGKATDLSGIQFRVLNRSKGPAVRGLRAQADRNLYKKAIKSLLKKEKNLDILEEEVIDLDITNKSISGVVLPKKKVPCETVVLTTGTFLNGLIHIGNKKIPAGRIGEKATYGLSKTFKKYGFKLGRMKTGTPPRIAKKSINFKKLIKQNSDKKITPFSFMNNSIKVKQVPCFITSTNEKTHKIIEKNIVKSAIYSGQIKSTGPRYCPSIEDKIVRFKDKKQHHIFLEPEGLNSDVIYPNGISTSLPENIQKNFVQSIVGLENAKILQYGYAIEYDYVDPLQLSNTLETNKIKNLYLAGQINGTTGYEEAAAQGIVAGINASLKVMKKAEFVLSRSEAYIGVLIDDLINKGVTEPYRMFTSRAEYRLLLRSDNADLRLTPKGISTGCVKKEREKRFKKKELLLKKIDKKYKKKTFSPNKLLKLGIKINLDGKKRNIFDLLVFKDINRKKLEEIWPEIRQIPNDIFEELETKSVYKGYVDRQLQDINDLKKDEELKIPDNLDYNEIPNLATEDLEKLNYIKPKNLGEITRISGVTPAAVINILRFVNKKTNKNSKKKWAI